MATPGFELYKDERGQFRYRLNAGNGECILSGEAYASKQGCLKGIDSVRTNAAFDRRFEKKESRDARFYFVIKARNGEVIGKSGMYNSASGRDKGIRSVALNAPIADVIDQTR